MRKKFRKNIISRVPKSERLDLLLVYPPWIAGMKRGSLQRMLPPLGILSIASHIEQHGYSVQVLDAHSEGTSIDEFCILLEKLRPRYVGISVLSAHFVVAHHMAHLCKLKVPDAIVVAGGVHAEANPEEMLANPAFDMVVRGDGEEAMLEIMKNIPPEKIPGLGYRENGRVVNNPARPIEMNLDRFPDPAYHLVDFDKYFPPVSSYKDLPAMNLLMTRGCPGKCTFCNSAKTVLRSRSTSRMISLIKMLRHEYGVRQLYFYDDTFTANPKNVKDFCRAMIEAKLDVSWICYVRGDMFSDDVAKLMSEAGCHQVLLGIESGSSTLMEKIGKPIDVKKYKDTVERAHRFNIEVRGSFIIGHVDETMETMKETTDFAKYLDLDFFQLNIMTPYPGTQLFKNLKLEGQLLHEDYNLYGQNELVFKLKNLMPQQVYQYEKAAFKAFYFRPGMVLKQLGRLKNIRMLGDLFKALALLIFEFKVGKDKALEEWLRFDVRGHSLEGIVPPEQPQLTYQLRQGFEG